MRRGAINDQRGRGSGRAPPLRMAAAPKPCPRDRSTTFIVATGDVIMYEMGDRVCEFWKYV